MKDELRKRIDEVKHGAFDPLGFPVTFNFDELISLINDLASALEESEQENARLWEALIAIVGYGEKITITTAALNKEKQNENK